MAEERQHPDQRYLARLRARGKAKGETVWVINKDDLPVYPLYTVQEVARIRVCRLRRQS